MARYQWSMILGACTLMNATMFIAWGGHLNFFTSLFTAFAAGLTLARESMVA